MDLHPGTDDKDVPRGLFMPAPADTRRPILYYSSPRCYADFMARLMAIVIFLYTAPVVAVEFQVCTSMDGKRHFTNVPAIYMDKCELTHDYHHVIFQHQYSRTRQDLLTPIPLISQQGVDAIFSGAEEIKTKLINLLDADQALESLHDKQQSSRGKLPFKTHLQTEGFQRLLNMQ